MKPAIPEPSGPPFKRPVRDTYVIWPDQGEFVVTPPGQAPGGEFDTRHPNHPAAAAYVHSMLANPKGRYMITVDGEEIDHADSIAEAVRHRNTVIYGGIGTEASTQIKIRSPR